MALDVKRFIARFVDEARDHLRRLEGGFAALKADSNDREVVDAIFRSAHTIKGSSRMLKLMPISETAHKLEEVLGALRAGNLAYSPELMRLLQRGTDSIARLVDQVAEGRDLAPPDQSLCDEMLRVANDANANARPVATPTAAPIEAGPAAASPRLKTPDTVRIPMHRLDDLIKLMGEVVSSHARLRQRVADIRDMDHLEGDISTRRHAFAQALRDDVLAQELLMEELHGKALVMRMLPLSMVFESAPRMVRDLARSVGKDVECVVSGADIEIDRQLIDRLGDPIVHLLRNAVDHGIETTAIRQRAGKPALGRVHLAARQDAGCVVIEVGDDGGGLSLPAIRDKAVRKGLMTTEAAATLTETEAIDLIFQPGFSTNAIITDVSGRGVGMDVVKRCVVDELQGTVAVETRPGLGCTFILRLPLSLAVMRVLMVRAGGEILGFTAQQVIRLLRLPEQDLVTAAERPTVRVDDEFIPVVDLANLLSLPHRPATSMTGRDLLLVVVRVRNDKLGLRIDDLIDERDMVIKPLPEHLAHIALVSGVVMTGSDTLVSVLHAPALLDLARKVQGGAQPGDGLVERLPNRILVVDDSLNTREIERDVLEAHGYRVSLAEDGRDGLTKALNGDFDAILTDVEMPNMDGFALTAALRGDERYHHVPIIIITSRQKEEDKRRGIEVGADAYIVKGDFDQSGLITTLKSLLG